MKLGMALFGAAALIGAGYVIGKKIIEKKRDDDEFYELDDLTDEELEELIDDDSDVGIYAKSGYGDKIKKASLFAVGAIKTGADKFGETIQDIRNKDMVKKGEQTVGAVKETGDNIKKDIKRDIEDLKEMVSSNQDEDKNDSDSVDELFGGKD
ncbi:MAG: hypothetical protein FWF82_00355 [Oscillospiraceae bacterium]|nr:hypothetical protein [Oscillospiraceae bacterium]